MSELDQDIVNELRKVNAAIEALPKAIVAAILEDLVDQLPDQPAVSIACQHPADKRVDLGDGEWECGVRACRHRHTPTPEGVPV